MNKEMKENEGTPHYLEKVHIYEALYKSRASIRLSHICSSASHHLKRIYRHQVHAHVNPRAENIIMRDTPSAKYKGDLIQSTFSQPPVGHANRCSSVQENLVMLRFVVVIVI